MKRILTTSVLMLALVATTGSAGETFQISGGPDWQEDLTSYVEELNPQATFAGHRTSEIERFASRTKGKSSVEPGCECNSCCPGWFVTADYLHWRVERNDLAFAIFDPAGLGVPNAGSPIMSLDLDASSGFRAGGGRRTPDGWELGVFYTYLESEGSQTYAPGAGQVIAVQSSPSTGLVSADSVNADSTFEYGVIDLEAGHWFHTGDTISLLVLGGLRHMMIDHVFETRYNGGAFVNGLATVATDTKGFGGRVGGQAHWNFAPQFSAFAKTAVSVLKADVDASRIETNGGATVINATRTTDQIIPGIEVGVGLRLSMDQWSIAAGYEWTNWFNAVNPLEFGDSFNGGTLNPVGRDLGLHGIYLNSSYVW